MELLHLDEFRRYYNTHIYPELQRTERLRKRLLALIGLSIFFILVIFSLAFSLNIAALSMFLIIPLVFYIGYLAQQVIKFKQTFKPRIVGLILDFMNEQLNFSRLSYDPKQMIPKLLFQQSQIFHTKAPYYQGEDFIRGFVGEMPFGLSEISVREFSPMTNKLQDVFQGIFIHAIFPEEETEGTIIVWPRHRKLMLTRSIKEFNFMGGENVDHEINIPEFRANFLVYAEEGTHVEGILSEPMQEAIMRYASITDKDIYMAFHDRHIFAGITEDRDLLEPRILFANTSFDLVRQFYFDIMLALKIIEDFDQTH